MIKTLLTFHWFVDPKIWADYKPYKTWVVLHPPTPYPNQPGYCMITAHTMLVSPKKISTLRAPQRIVRTATMISQMALADQKNSKAPIRLSRELLGCPRKLGSMVSKWVVTYNKWNGVYWGYNPLTKLLLTSWDIQVGGTPFLMVL